MAGHRDDIRLQPSQAAFSTTSSTSVGLTVAATAGKRIYLTRIISSYTGAAQTVTQLTRIFDGATEVFRTGGLSGSDIIFYSPIEISTGSNLVATVSVSVNTIAGNLFASYFVE